MHVTLPISTETTLMGADNIEAYEEAITHNGFSLINYTDGKDEADRLFNGLSGNGRAGLPMNLTFWGSYHGICVDKFGICRKITLDQNLGK